MHLYLTLIQYAIFLLRLIWSWSQFSLAVKKPFRIILIWIEMHLFRKISCMVIPSMSTSICYTNFSHTFRVFSPSCFCKSFVSSFFFSINLFFSYNRYASESVKQIGLVESVHLILAMRFIYSYLLRKSLICFAEGFSSRNHCAIERKQCFFLCVLVEHRLASEADHTKLWTLRVYLNRRDCCCLYTFHELKHFILRRFAFNGCYVFLCLSVCMCRKYFMKLIIISKRFLRP